MIRDDISKKSLMSRLKDYAIENSGLVTAVASFPLIAQQIMSAFKTIENPSFREKPMEIILAYTAFKVVEPLLIFNIADWIGQIWGKPLQKKRFYEEYDIKNTPHKEKEYDFLKSFKSDAHIFLGDLKSELFFSKSSAVKDYKKAKDACPDSCLPNYKLFDTYLKLKDYKECLKYAREVLSTCSVKGIDKIINSSSRLASLELDELLDKKKDPIIQLEKAVIARASNRYEMGLGAIVTGNSAIIILSKDKAWKYSNDIKKEARLMQMVSSRTSKIAENVIAYWGEVQHDICLEIECIKGKSIESIIDKQGKISPDKVLRYSSGIMNGLIELRRSDIYYHRDIRPANIVINEYDDKAIIVDLGMATTEKHPSLLDDTNHTRRWGGKNDIVSLGQLMYTMSTGGHLFERLGGYCNGEIKENREKAYENPAIFNKYIEKIDSTIHDGRLNSLIKECLKAKNWDYGKMNKMFKKSLESLAI